MTQPRRIFWFGVVALTFLLLPCSASAQSAPATDDATISLSSPTTNNGASSNLGVQGPNLQESYVRFDLSVLPSGLLAPNINKATLRLFLSNVSVSGTFDVRIVTGIWNEKTLTYNNAPAAGQLIAGSVAVNTSQMRDFVLVDVTSAVQAWLSGTANNGIVLIASPGSSISANFDSKEASSTSHDPEIEMQVVSSGPTGPQGPQGATGATGAAGAPGAAATVQVGTTMTAPAGTLASVVNTGSQTAAVLNFLIPQGATGTQGAQGTQGTQGPAGLTNRGAWSIANGYAVNDAVSDQGSFWLALQAIPANTPNSEPSATNASWQLLAAQGATGAQGAQGPQGQAGPQGPMGFMGLQGPPGQNPVGAALTTQSNTFAGSQTINGNLILASSGGIQFADGTSQTTASSGGAGGCPAAFEVSSVSPVTPPGYTALSQTTAGNLWFTMAPMPTPRSLLAAVALNGKIYAIGGRGFASDTGIVEIYDVATNTWTNAAPMPTAREFLAAAAVNGKIYAIGGRDANFAALNTVEAYDPSTNTWNAVAPLPTARGELATSVVNGKIYAIGGANYPSLGNGGFQIHLLNTVEAYDPATNTWSAAASMSAPRDDLATAAVNGKIYAIGGLGGNILFQTVEAYDPGTNSWTAAASVPTPRSLLAAAAVNGRIYAIGGFDPNFNALNTVEAYDPTTNAWAAVTPMATARGGLAAADVNSLIYAIGGLNQVSAVEQYSPPVTIYTFIKN